jgi:hypothetical protein
MKTKFNYDGMELIQFLLFIKDCQMGLTSQNIDMNE